MDYFEHLARRLSGEEPNVPSWLGAKNATRPFADLIGIATPKLHFAAKPLELPSKTFPGRFVIKPAFASTSIGVKLLEKAAPGNYIDLTSGSPVSVGELVEEYSQLSNKYFDDPNAGDVLVEHLLEAPDGTTPPKDVRVYAFQGEIGFILCEEHIGGKATAAYYNHDFSVMEDVDRRFGIAEGASDLEAIFQEAPPENHAEIISVAKRISTAVPAAFCRIDLYNAKSGINLGELTFFPGTFYYKNRKLMLQPEADRLGKMWDDAEARLQGSTVKAPRWLQAGF